MTFFNLNALDVKHGGDGQVGEGVAQHLDGRLQLLVLEVRVLVHARVDIIKDVVDLLQDNVHVLVAHGLCARVQHVAALHGHTQNWAHGGAHPLNGLQAQRNHVLNPVEQIVELDLGAQHLRSVLCLGCQKHGPLLVSHSAAPLNNVHGNVLVQGVRRHNLHLRVLQNLHVRSVHLFFLSPFTSNRREMC